mmetsp:Transcript_62546/g.204115  ORF Transcript_62546/g.204115 Transcript_62546/m.204115 type:complete len:557 (+) Transcript_62546:117-1787(+)
MSTTTMTTSFASRFAADIRNAVSGKGTPADKRTITVLALALLCAAAPLDISQLAMLLVGAAAYALLQPVSLPRSKAPFKNAPAVPQPKVPTAPPSPPLTPSASPAKYVPPALRPGFARSAPAAPAAAVGQCRVERAAPRPLQRLPRAAAAAPVSWAAPDSVRQPSAQPVSAPTFEASGWDAQVNELVAQLLPTAAGDQAVERLAQRVRLVLRQFVPEAEVTGFASSAPLRGCAFGVAVPDVDVVVSCDPEILSSRLQAGANRHARGGGSTDHRQLQKSALRAFTDRLVASGQFKFRRSAFSAEDPKVTLLPTAEGNAAGAPLDVAVNSATPLHNAALLTECGRLDARAQALALLVRRWARDRGICHSAKGHLSPYAWTLLTIYFLQVVEEEGAILPPLDGFKISSSLAGLPSKSDSKSAAGAAAAAAAAAAPKRAAGGAGKSVGALFKEFVAFYGKSFDVRREAVSVRLGRRAAAALALPLHIALAEDGGAASEVGLNIEDPFEPTRNLGASMTASGVQRLRQELARAGGLLASREGASLTALLEPWSPEEPSQAA